MAAVSRAFDDNGRGARGDMTAVLKAVLLHPEARRGADHDGKLREPVLRLPAYLRAFPHASDTGRWRVGNTDNTDNAASALGQSPLRAPSVFNFYRPGYIAPGTRSAEAGLAAPELQIAHETSVAGYVHFMRDALNSGVGRSPTPTPTSATSSRACRASMPAGAISAGSPADLGRRRVGTTRRTCGPGAGRR